MSRQLRAVSLHQAAIASSARWHQCRRSPSGSASQARCAFTAGSVSFPRCHMISATRSTEICCSIGRICPLANCARVSNDHNDRTWASDGDGPGGDRAHSHPTVRANTRAGSRLRAAAADWFNSQATAGAAAATTNMAAAIRRIIFAPPRDWDDKASP